MYFLLQPEISFPSVLLPKFCPKCNFHNLFFRGFELTNICHSENNSRQPPPGKRKVCTANFADQLFTRVTGVKYLNSGRWIYIKFEHKCGRKTGGTLEVGIEGGRLACRSTRRREFPSLKRNQVFEVSPRHSRRSATKLHGAVSERARSARVCVCSRKPPEMDVGTPKVSSIDLSPAFTRLEHSTQTSCKRERRERRKKYFLNFNLLDMRNDKFFILIAPPARPRQISAQKRGRNIHIQKMCEMKRDEGVRVCALSECRWCDLWMHCGCTFLHLPTAISQQAETQK